jgi:hypothetical protein
MSVVSNSSTSRQFKSVTRCGILLVSAELDEISELSDRIAASCTAVVALIGGTSAAQQGRDRSIDGGGEHKPVPPNSSSGAGTPRTRLSEEAHHENITSQNVHRLE